jgi:hypothetical protein
VRGLSGKFGDSKSVKIKKWKNKKNEKVKNKKMKLRVNFGGKKCYF